MKAKFDGCGVRAFRVAAAFRTQRGRWKLLLLIAAAFAISQIAMPFAMAAQKKKMKMKTKVNPKDGLTYVWIPAGKFMMGCSAGDTHCAANEKPAHMVTLTKGFWIGQTPVTQKAYTKVAAAHPEFFQEDQKDYPVERNGINPSIFKGPDLPVEQLTWDAARHYCEDVGMRLPTEAEYEYAARGGSDQPTWGPIDQIAWYDTAPVTFLPTEPDGSTHPVTQKKPNPYGLYDILGNVWEWTADWYGPYTAAAQVDPTGPDHGSYRVLRGGSWDARSPSVSTRSRGKFWQRGGNFGGDRGVRCVGN